MFKSGVIQAKLKIGQPNDVYEQEADRVAEQVMRMPENTALTVSCQESGAKMGIFKENVPNVQVAKVYAQNVLRRKRWCSESH